MIGYAFAVLIGLSLGLMGGGGSILTVPVLVYSLGIDPKTAIALSLAIVGFTSIFGIIGHFRNQNINFKVISFFAPITMIGSLAGSYLSTLISGQVQLLLFALIMLASSILMIKGREESTETKRPKTSLLIFSGLIVGIISGIVGVGGGFLIVPALVLLANIPMKKAIGTSLVVISLSSLTGFIGHALHMDIPWSFLVKFILFSGAGIILGTNLVKYIPQAKLKVSFGYFLILMGGFILYKNSSVLF